jgi:hypothetical protein
VSHEIVEVTSVEWLGGHRLRLGFHNGDVGEVDLSKYLRFDGVFEPLGDPAFVAKVRVDAESGTVCWPGGVDLDPVVLHHRATGKPLPDWAGPIDE